MKTSLEHLPAHKKEELQSITDMIVLLVKPEMVILFGSYSRGNWVEDRHVEDGILFEYKSDYDILVVTEHHQDMPAGLGKKVRSRIKRAECLQTTPHIIFHDINFLNKELEEGHYFFRDILHEGTMLYTTGKYELATPKELSNYQRAQKAKLYFNIWYKDANVFFKNFEFNFKEGQLDRDFYKAAIFLLHQTVEKFFASILLVFTDYKPQTHDLNDLDKQVGYADARFKTIFPKESPEEKRLFALLVKSYIDSRYKLHYTVSPSDLQWLAGRVERLKILTKELCEEWIRKMAGSFGL